MITVQNVDALYFILFNLFFSLSSILSSKNVNQTEDECTQE